MKDHFINIDMDYDIDTFISMYDTTSLQTSGPFAAFNGDLTGYEDVVNLFDKFSLPLNNSNCKLTTIFKAVSVHTNPGNNGLILFPLAGDLVVKFYSAEPPIVNGLPMLTPYLKNRPHLTSNEYNTIINSEFATKILKNPIAINGRKLYAYSPANGTIPLVFLLKIPFGVEWNQIQTVIENLHA